jgi:hypothetical protein
VRHCDRHRDILDFRVLALLVLRIGRRYDQRVGQHLDVADPRELHLPLQRCQRFVLAAVELVLPRLDLGELDLCLRVARAGLLTQLVAC